MPLRIRRTVAPLVLASSLLALAATGCSSETADGAGAQTSPSPSAEVTTEPSPEPSTEPSTEPTEDSSGACATGDLNFTVSEQSQAGGYYLVTATAKPGVTCTLAGRTIEAGFGSDVAGDVMPSEQAEGEPITMTGSIKAYAGVNPHSGPQEGGVQFEEIIVSAGEGDMDPVSLKLPSTAEVDQPIGTNWHTDATKAVPYSS
ncbi:DUF4232 domain-containing protein [Nocardioides sp. NPDC057772]|uniref:DUF4232 domain-containing protein n=1 Tax=Nocardioides sp. NPDC057772 TaxID=3346245 RepID=UPI00366F9D02